MLDWLPVRFSGNVKARSAGPPRKSGQLYEALILELRSEAWMRGREIQVEGHSGHRGMSPGRAGERQPWPWTWQAVGHQGTGLSAKKL